MSFIFYNLLLIFETYLNEIISRSASDAAAASSHKKISCLNLMQNDLTTDRSESALEPSLRIK